MSWQTLFICEESDKRPLLDDLNSVNDVKSKVLHFWKKCPVLAYILQGSPRDKNVTDKNDILLFPMHI